VSMMRDNRGSGSDRSGPPGLPPRPSSPPTSGLAVASVVVSAIGFLGAFIVVGLPFALVAVVLGHVSLVRIRKAECRLGGKPAAIAGLVVGYGSAGLALLIGVAAVGLLALGRNVAIPAEFRGKDATTIHREVVRLLGAGKQSDAEQILLAVNARLRPDPRLVFVQGVCRRSRWNKSEATRLFGRVVKLAPGSPEAQAAASAIALDTKQKTKDNFARLRELASAHPTDPFFPWLFAIQARDYWRRTGNTRYSREAAEAYGKVLEVFDVGPVMVHHTYANVLDEELGRYEDALKHRRIAVGQGPAAWSLHGMGNTFYAMKRYAEAADAYGRASQISPNDVTYLFDWACALSMQKKLDACVEKCRRVVALDPKHHRCHSTLGNALRCQGQHVEALKHFREALLISHNYRHAYQEAGETLWELGKVAEGNRLQEIKIRPRLWREAIRIISGVTGQDVPPGAQTDPDYLKPFHP
jgi:tetratricopeptide (TPR) repeat protein